MAPGIFSSTIPGKKEYYRRRQKQWRQEDVSEYVDLTIKAILVELSRRLLVVQTAESNRADSKVTFLTTELKGVKDDTQQNIKGNEKQGGRKGLEKRQRQQRQTGKREVTELNPFKDLTSQQCDAGQRHTKSNCEAPMNTLHDTLQC